MISLRLAFFLIIVATFAIFLTNKLSESGLFSHTEDFNLEDCKSIATVPGLEDIQVDLSQDLLYLSVFNWSTFYEGKPDRKGGIYTLDLKEKDAKLHHASNGQPSEFFPHGLHLYEDPQTGEKTLFVINHKKDGHFIEIFDVIDRKTLKHRETLTHPLLVSPNEILGTGKRSFYTSQDTNYRGDAWYLPILVALGMEEGSLVYFDGTNFKRVAEHIHLANGLSISPDKKTLYFGETSKRRLRVYDRDIKTGDLNFKTTYDMDTPIDNMNIDPEENIWIVGIPNLLAFMSHQFDKTKGSPVEILKAKFEGEKLVDLRRMLSSSGKTLSGITTVAFYNGKIIMGGLTESEVTMCSLPKDVAQVKPIINIDL